MNPQQILEGMLQGISPPRPLFLPIVFSLGAKLENLPLGTFLKNPTKITNSLMQMRNHLRSDGHACYFDPWLEVEALGGTLEWVAGEERPGLRWSRQPVKGELPEGLCSPEDAVKRGRVGIALEVIRRLKSLLRDGSLLTAGVTGPFTLAARLTQLEDEPALRQIPEAALDIAASLVTRMSEALVDAGANLIMIREEVLPSLTAESCEDWASWLSPALNIIRFYRALPVLLLTDQSSFTENCELIFQQKWDGVVCPALDSGSLASIRTPDNLMLGIALPAKALTPQQTGDEPFERSLDYAISILRPSILTTAMDVPAGADLNRLKAIAERVLKA